MSINYLVVVVVVVIVVVVIVVVVVVVEVVVVEVVVVVIDANCSVLKCSLSLPCTNTNIIVAHPITSFGACTREA